MSYAPHPPRGPGRRRAVVAAGAAGLVITGVFTAGSTDSSAAQLRLAAQAANQARTGRVTRQAGSGATAAGTRLLGEAATAARSVPYRAVQIISWLAPGSSAGWLGSSPGRVSMDVSHRSGQPPDVGLGLSPTLVGLLDAHYVVVYTGQGAAAGRTASVVEVCRRNGGVAARFWLDDATKLPLRREIFDSRTHLISVDDLASLHVAARAATGRGTPAANAASARPQVTVHHQGAASHAVGNRISAEISMGGLAGLPATASPAPPVSPAARAPASPAGPVARLPLTRLPLTRLPLTRWPAAQLPAVPAGATAGPDRPWADRLGQAQIGALRTGGWPVPAAMPGGLTLFGASESRTSTGRVVDLAYSDGLSVISLFLQRGQLPAALPGWRQTRLGGHPVYLRNPAEPDLAWTSGGYVYTVVAGAPAPVIASVVDSLPYQGRPGFWSRMDRGVRRMFSWINPFR